MGFLDLFSNKKARENQEKVNKTIATFEKRVTELENDIKVLMERFEELNKGLAEVREIKQAIIEQTEQQKEEAKKPLKRGRKLKNTMAITPNSENKDDDGIKAELNELKSNKKGTSKRRGRPKKEKEEGKPTSGDEDLSPKTETSDKVEKPKTKQSKKPKSEVAKSNTKRGRKPKEENKTTSGKKRGRPKKIVEPIPDAAVMGLDYDETTEFQKPKEVKKSIKSVKLKSTDKIESLADVIEISNRGDE